MTDEIAQEAQENSFINLNQIVLALGEIALNLGQMAWDLGSSYILPVLYSSLFTQNSASALTQSTDSPKKAEPLHLAEERLLMALNDSTLGISALKTSDDIVEHIKKQKQMLRLLSIQQNHVNSGLDEFTKLARSEWELEQQQLEKKIEKALIEYTSEVEKIARAEQEWGQALKAHKASGAGLVDFFISIFKPVTTWFGWKTSKELLEVKKEAFAAVTTIIKKPDFSTEYHELAEEKQKIEDNIKVKQDEITAFTQRIEQIKQNISALEAVVKDLRSLREQAASEPDDVAIEIVPDDNVIRDELDTDTKSVSTKEPVHLVGRVSPSASDLAKQRLKAGYSDDESDDEDNEFVDDDIDNSSYTTTSSVSSEPEGIAIAFVAIKPSSMKKNTLYVQLTENSIIFSSSLAQEIKVARNELKKQWADLEIPAYNSPQNKKESFFQENKDRCLSLVQLKRQEQEDKATQEAQKKAMELDKRRAEPKVTAAQLLIGAAGTAFINRVNSSAATPEPSDDNQLGKTNEQVQQQMQKTKANLVARDLRDGCALLKLEQKNALDEHELLSSLLDKPLALVIVDDALFFMSKGLSKIDGALKTVFKYKELTPLEGQEESYNKLKSELLSLEPRKVRNASEKELRLVIASVTGIDPDAVKKEVIQGSGDEAMNERAEALKASDGDFNKIRGALVFCKSPVLGLKTTLSITDFENADTIQKLQEKIDALYLEIRTQKTIKDLPLRCTNALTTLYDTLTNPSSAVTF